MYVSMEWRRVARKYFLNMMGDSKMKADKIRRLLLSKNKCIQLLLLIFSSVFL